MSAAPNSRLEAFCDGVFAIAITLLIIEIKVPKPEVVHSTADLWHAIQHLAPAIGAFALSFIIILITWVNHHNCIKLVNKSAPTFIYANGFLLLTVAFFPFPTAMLGEYILTDHATPGVVLYNATLALQACSWILINGTALKHNLGKNEKANQLLSNSKKFGFFAAVLYSGCAILAFWFPVTAAIISTVTWIFWLIYGITLKHEEMN